MKPDHNVPERYDADRNVTESNIAECKIQNRIKTEHEFQGHNIPEHNILECKIMENKILYRKCTEKKKYSVPQIFFKCLYYFLKSNMSISQGMYTKRKVRFSSLSTINFYLINLKA